VKLINVWQIQFAGTEPSPVLPVQWFNTRGSLNHYGIAKSFSVNSLFVIPLCVIGAIGKVTIKRLNPLLYHTLVRGSATMSATV